jgi:N-acetylneuraminic acid mutarotase
MKKSFYYSMLVVLLCALLSSCSGGGSGAGTFGLNLWTWVSGSNVIDQSGTYGTKGTAHADNIPGARDGAVSWIDADGNLWLFGGYGRDSTGAEGELNDLWKFDGTNWTWVSGSNIVDQPGVYGTKGTAHADNIPGARYGSVSWTDADGNLWLFGGHGYDSAGTDDNLNDLWKFDGTNWTWVSGANVCSQQGIYGTKGTAHADNIPGARYGSVSWIGADGSLWLFGGHGYDSAGDWGYLNDLWKFDGTNWTWVSGSNVCNQQGVYGTQGAAHADNVPGARYIAVSWIDADGSLWLFGGSGRDSAGDWGNLNDLWKFDGTNWTWVSGADAIGQSGTYGTKGTAHADNIPGARKGSVSWMAADGNLWFFGGYGRDSAGSWGKLNDLWRYVPN